MDNVTHVYNAFQLLFLIFIYPFLTPPRPPFPYEFLPYISNFFFCFVPPLQ